MSHSPTCMTVMGAPGLVTPSETPGCARFGEFQLDYRNGELRRNGTPVKLQPQPAKVLMILVGRAGQIVTRQELAEQVWGSETFVDFEQGLNFAIRQIRAALQDDAEHPRFLQTLPKRGYRFAATVTGEVPAVDASASKPLPRPAKFGSRHALLLLGMALAVTLVYWLKWGHSSQTSSNTVTSSRIQSLAVLPLHNLSPDQEYEYFSEGMTDELITHLAQIGKLRVISHTSVNRYKDTKQSLREIGKELGVDAVIEGTIMRSGNRVRITAQLIDARTDQHLWAESYERDLKDILALQSEVAEQIASKVGISLTAAEQTRLEGTRPLNPAAHELYLRGNVYSNLLNCTGWAKGLDYYQQAITKDPNYTLAHLGASDSYFHLADSACWPQTDTFAKSRSAALKALELDTSLGKIHTLLGNLAFYHDWDWPKAEKEYAHAIELDPNDAGAHAAYAVFLVAMNRQKEGLAQIQLAHQLDPVSEHTNMIHSYVLYLAHQYDQSIEQSKKTLELYPRSGASYYWLGQAYEGKGMQKQAADAYMTSGTLGGDGKEGWLESSRRAFQEGGIAGYWRRQSQEQRNQGAGGTCWKSFLYAHMGDREQTLQWLDWGFQHHCDGLQFLKAEPIYDNLRDDPRFKALVTQLQL